MDNGNGLTANDWKRGLRLDMERMELMEDLLRKLSKRGISKVHVCSDVLDGRGEPTAGHPLKIWVTSEGNCLCGNIRWQGCKSLPLLTTYLRIEFEWR